MAHLHLLAGKPASGKSTLAAELAKQPNAILIGEDSLLSTLFGDEMATIDDYIRCSKKLKTALTPHILQLLASDLTVILDFPGNTPGQREWMRSLIDQAGCPHTLHVLGVPDAVCKARLRVRNSADGNPFKLTEEQFDVVASYFSYPDEEEGFNVV